ncbi:hypothetical protein FJY63_03525 [Candidatus Sumerlaeota bacterium]|nr:hypothetical protein [Candidatus Sumerlaeota bacterium]
MRTKSSCTTDAGKGYDVVIVRAAQTGFGDLLLFSIQLFVADESCPCRLIERS